MFVAAIRKGHTVFLTHIVLLVSCISNHDSFTSRWDAPGWRAERTPLARKSGLHSYAVP